jgi:predicted nucleic acid-binding protein
LKVIADTGFLVALLGERDQRHTSAVDLSDAITEPLLTCEEVLAEAAYILGDSRPILQLVADGEVEIDFEIALHVDQLQSFAEAYQDQNPDLADLCLVRMSELNPHLSVVTTDRDFRIYRRFGNKPIPLIMPPGM